MDTSSQPTAVERVSETTISNTEVALTGIPSHVTVAEAARLSGLSDYEIRNRAAKGQIDSYRAILVSTRDLASEITTTRMAAMRELIVSVVGEDGADDGMGKLGFIVEDVTA